MGSCFIYIYTRETQQFQFSMGFNKLKDNNQQDLKETLTYPAGSMGGTYPVDNKDRDQTGGRGGERGGSSKCHF